MTAAGPSAEPRYNPFDPSSSVAIATARIHARAARSLEQGAKYSAILGGLGFGGLVVMTAMGQSGFEIPLVFSAVGGGYSLVIWWLAKKGYMRGPTKVVVFSLFASIPTFFLLTAEAYLPFGAATFLSGPMVFLYFHLIIMSGFLFDPRLSIFTGMVTAGGYFVVCMLALDDLARFTIPDEMTFRDYTDPTLYGFRAVMMGFSGLVVAALAYVSRQLVLATVQKAYERGSYSLVRRIGYGGMGEVWEAKHQMLARPAAVKMIKIENFEDKRTRASRILDRFEREAQATARLRSPHTVELYDFGQADDGTFYQVMELLDGVDLETLVEAEGPLPPERVVHLLRQVCASLAEAHGQGLVHRDIKPQNLFLCRHGTELDFVKVLDFGLVQSDEDDDEGTIAGTPAYMAPEVIHGEAEIDARADIYALGCVAYWLLTAQTPFEGDLKEVLAAHLADTPDPPSERTELAIPAELDAIVLRCLEKAADDRFANVTELSERLCELGIEEDWTPERRTVWWQTQFPQFQAAAED